MVRVLRPQSFDFLFQLDHPQLAADHGIGKFLQLDDLFLKRFIGAP